jgi:hypothetical protein
MMMTMPAIPPVTTSQWTTAGWRWAGALRACVTLPHLWSPLTRRHDFNVGEVEGGGLAADLTSHPPRRHVLRPSLGRFVVEEVAVKPVAARRLSPALVRACMCAYECIFP